MNVLSQIILNAKNKSAKDAKDFGIVREMFEQVDIELDKKVLYFVDFTIPDCDPRDPSHQYRLIRMIDGINILKINDIHPGGIAIASFHTVTKEVNALSRDELIRIAQHLMATK